MVVNKETNRFITQRQYPKMALITPQFEGSELPSNEKLGKGAYFWKISFIRDAKLNQACPFTDHIFALLQQIASRKNQSF